MSDSEKIHAIIGAIITFALCILLGAVVDEIQTKKITGQRQFILNDASYKCTKTNELKEGE